MHMLALSLKLHGEDDSLSPAETYSPLCQSCDPTSRTPTCTGACPNPPKGIGLMRCLHYTIKEAKASGFRQTARLLELARAMLAKEGDFPLG